MSSIETGTNWGVKREFIPPALAKGAARPASYLSGLDDRKPIHFAYRELGHDQKGVSAFRVDVRTLADSTLFRLFSDLLEVYRRTEEETGNGLGHFHVNSYGSGGLTSSHADTNREPAVILAVILSGSAEATVQDPEAGERITRLDPGDAIYFLNSAPPAERPMYVVRSAIVGPTRALVNGQSRPQN